jgi:hypothetical protein
MIFNTIDAIECFFCKSLLRADSEQFISIHGNICIGQNGGVIGNNLDDDGRVARTTCICRSEHCLNQLTKLLIGSKTTAVYPTTSQ